MIWSNFSSSTSIEKTVGHPAEIRTRAKKLGGALYRPIPYSKGQVQGKADMRVALGEPVLLDGRQGLQASECIWRWWCLGRSLDASR